MGRSTWVPTPGASVTPDAQPGLAEMAVKGLCPRCRAPTLFAGTVRFAQHCRACGLDFGAFNVGDGPAAFLTLILGTLITVLAVMVELAFSPAWWVHLLLWLPLGLVTIVAALRLTKAALIALEYRNAAREGRIVEGDGE
ncbi:MULTISPECIES: DUF983 domain-containing protein [unclassified Sphingomonas]|uniref:DUF983 domain-containing protein n=1 Tax=unclassified Sphingomonas TaxID=196159 RepID=UPI0009E81CDB